MGIEKHFEDLPVVEGDPVNNLIVGFAGLRDVAGYKPVFIVGRTEEMVVYASRADRVSSILKPQGVTSIGRDYPQSFERYVQL